ncbi:MAG: ligase-associated DNA damage response endonuclease PdeM [Planctomycetia bacterium]|nr:ligase-associated DNA damage response endonuclease PdeM [Planctomycetia bacterium]
MDAIQDVRVGTAADGDLVLLAGRAAFVPATATLLVADVHLGKAATFRRAGIPVPEGTAQRDLDRLVRLAATHAARRVVVLGDLLHAKGGCTDAVWAEFRDCRKQIAAEIVLVLGNHDRGLATDAARLAERLGIDACVAALDEPPFRFVHEPASPRDESAGDRTVVAGHLHPTVAITAPGGDRLVERCFVADPGAVVLPAFGSFTGGHRIATAPRRRLWVARDDGVVEVTRMAELAARRRR